MESSSATHAVIFMLRISSTSCFKIKDWYARLRKKGEAHKVTIIWIYFLVFSSAEQRAVKRQMGGKKQVAKNECVLMWNGEQNWSNGLKKLLLKWKGSDNRFLVDSRKAIWNSCWRAQCGILLWGCQVCGSACVPFPLFLYLLPLWNNSTLKKKIARIINALISGWRQQDLSHNSQINIMYIKNELHLTLNVFCMCSQCGFCVYWLRTVYWYYNTLYSALQGYLLKEFQTDQPLMDRIVAYWLYSISYWWKGSIMLITVWESLFIGT